MGKSGVFSQEAKTLLASQWLTLTSYPTTQFLDPWHMATKYEALGEDQTHY